MPAWAGFVYLAMNEKKSRFSRRQLVIAVEVLSKKNRIGDLDMSDAP